MEVLLMEARLYTSNRPQARQTARRAFAKVFGPNQEGRRWHFTIESERPSVKIAGEWQYECVYAAHGSIRIEVPDEPELSLNRAFTALAQYIGSGMFPTRHTLRRRRPELAHYLERTYARWDAVYEAYEVWREQQLIYADAPDDDQEVAA
jgi:hypothetical protein